MSGQTLKLTNFSKQNIEYFTIVDNQLSKLCGEVNYPIIKIDIESLNKSLLSTLNSSLREFKLYDTINVYQSIMSNPQNSLLATTTKELTSHRSDRSDRSGSLKYNLILSDNIEKIINSTNSPFIDKLRELLSLRINQHAFDMEYENLSPYDKMWIIEKLKKLDLIDDCYSDFYTAFIPLVINRELENKPIGVECGFQHLECGCRCKTRCDERGCVKISIKYPIGKNVGFDTTQSTHQSPASTQRIVWRTLFFSKFFPQHTPISVNLYLSTPKKTFDWYERMDLNAKINSTTSQLTPIDIKQLNRFIGPREINSGYCVVGDGISEKKIVIFRREEVDKILTHEFLHSLSVDYGMHSSKRTLKFFKENVAYRHFCNEVVGCDVRSMYNDNVVMNINEGYTDFCTDILNTLLYAIEVCKDTNTLSNDKVLALWTHLLGAEINFALFQAAKILVYFNFEKYQDIYASNIGSSINQFIGEELYSRTPNHSTSRRRFARIQQSTNVFSYFIIKVVCLLQLPDFLEVWGFHQSSNIIEYLSTRQSTKRKEITNLIIAGLYKPNVIKYINTYIRVIECLKVDLINEDTYKNPEAVRKANRERLASELLTTLRRSIVELE